MSSETEKDNKSSEEGKTDKSVDPAKVHSANSWESADLGDDERKKKFLKLMGASKKEHHGRFVIGNQEPVHVHAREKTETEGVNKQLEDQYKHSLDHRITRTHHTGLGFSGEEKKPEEAEKKTEDVDKSTSSETEGADKKDDQSIMVHSANSWESADLGDDERKKKFLKLMGASKKEHHGRFVIGNQEPVHVHAREKTETEVVNKQLEDQYKHSLENRITRRHHIGLGFSGEEKKPEEVEKKPEDVDKSNSSETEGADKKDNQSGDTSEGKGDHSDAAKDNQTEKLERKRESTDSNDKDSSATKKPKMMMSFVKSSDSS